MRINFLKAAAVSLALYTAALAAGIWGDFRVTLFAVLALQGTWTLFCAVRAVQLRIAGGHRPDAVSCDRESYGFAMGGWTSSFALLAVFVVLSQIVWSAGRGPTATKCQHKLLSAWH